VPVSGLIPYLRRETEPLPPLVAAVAAANGQTASTVRRRSIINVLHDRLILDNEVSCDSAWKEEKERVGRRRHTGSRDDE